MAVDSPVDWSGPLGPLIYGRDGNNYLIVASKGGAPDHPGWYKNLLADPDVKIQVWDKVIPVRCADCDGRRKEARVANHDNAVARLRHVPGRNETRHPRDFAHAALAA